ncbi:MAG: ABC transporter permease [Desulfuromonadales bacterium]|nr:ABC transporter permease [Desulfuromonadales bacterium]
MIRFDLSRRFIRVWQRNFVVYRKTWKIGFIPPLLEPLFYLAAFGVGLGVMVGRVTYASNSIPYTTFIAPALIAVNIMQSAFFETTFASFVRMFYQKTFDGMLATPLSVDEIITGELLWGATKSAIGTFLMMLVISSFGLLHYPGALLLLPIAFLGGLAFACAGMICTAIVPTIEVFNLPIFLFITPMFLFGGTFFPLSNLPAWAQTVAQTLPLTHLVQLCRGVSLGGFSNNLLFSLLYLLLWISCFYPLAIVLMRRRLIK